MNKNTVLRNMEKIKEERKLSKESKNAIIARCVANSAIGISIILLIFTFVFARNFLEKSIAIFIYKVYAVHFLIFTIVLFEIAYKKDSGKVALVSVELFALTIFTLFAPYFLYKFSIIYTYGIIALTTIYYAVKIIRIGCKERKQYLFNSNDFSNIIKKESKDKLAQEQIEQEEQERKENIQNETIEESEIKSNNIGLPLSKRIPKKVIIKKETTKGRPKKSSNTKTSINSKAPIEKTKKTATTKKNTKSKISSQKKTTVKEEKPKRTRKTETPKKETTKKSKTTATSSSKKTTKTTRKTTKKESKSKKGE